MRSSRLASRTPAPRASEGRPALAAGSSAGRARSPVRLILRGHNPRTPRQHTYYPGYANSLAAAVRPRAAAARPVRARLRAGPGAGRPYLLLSTALRSTAHSRAASARRARVPPKGCASPRQDGQRLLLPPHRPSTQPLRNLPQMCSSTTKAMKSRLSTSTVVGPLRGAGDGAQSAQSWRSNRRTSSSRRVRCRGRIRRNRRLPETARHQAGSPTPLPAGLPCNRRAAGKRAGGSDHVRARRARTRPPRARGVVAGREARRGRQAVMAGAHIFKPGASSV